MKYTKENKYFADAMDVVLPGDKAKGSKKQIDDVEEIMLYEDIEEDED